jgi:hypothetical protein
MALDGLELPKGAVAYDEHDLQKQILERAETRGKTGVSTSATLAAIQSVLTSSVSALSTLEAGSSLDEAGMLERDRLRIRIQLLNRLCQLRKVTSGPPGKPVEPTAPRNPAARVSSEHTAASIDTGDAVLAALRATAPARPIDNSRNVEVMRDSRRPIEPLNRNKIVPKSRSSSAAPLGSTTVVVTASTSPSAAAPSCPVCLRPLQDVSVGAIDRHVERCLRRQSVNQPVEVAGGSKDRIVSPPVVEPAKGPTDSAAASDCDSLFDSEHSVEYSDEELPPLQFRLSSSARGRGRSRNSAAATPSRAHRLTRSHRIANTVIDDWNDALFFERLHAAETEEAEDDEEEAGVVGGGPEGGTAARIVTFPSGLLLPRRIARALLPYQLTGVVWMFELYRRGVGGILGDEMGYVLSCIDCGRVRFYLARHQSLCTYCAAGWGRQCRCWTSKRAGVLRGCVQCKVFIPSPPPRPTNRSLLFLARCSR